MQNDLISRSALIERCEELSAIEWNNKAAPASWADAYDSFIEELEEAPAVDAVVLPVSPGQMVWILNHKFAAEIEEICVREDGVFAVWTEYERGLELTEVWDNGEFDIKEIGRTVFLTAVEWEKAMYPCEYCFSGTYRSCDGCSYGERRGDE